MNQAIAWKNFIHYLRTQNKQGVTYRQIALWMGVSERYIYKMLNSPRPILPKPIMRTKIHHLTQGKIGLADWIK